MGKRGPLKKPTKLKLLQGVPGGEHKLNENEAAPKLLDDTIPSPSWLCDRGKAIWKEVAEKLSKNGLLSEIDTNMLARYCDLAVRWFDARASYSRVRNAV